MKTTKLINYNSLILCFIFSFNACKADLRASYISMTSDDNPVQNQNLSQNENSPLEGINILAFDLFKNLSQPNENLFFSPYCVASSFSMLYPGSIGETKNEIQRFFHFSLDPEDNSKLYNKLNNEIRTEPHNSGEVNVANALWVQKEYKIKQPFLEQTTNYFNSELYHMDFINTPQSSCDSINRWISESTKHKIEKIINVNDLNSETRLILTNSIYFNHKWRDEFDKDLTKSSFFYNSNKTESAVKMMNKTSEFNYCEDSLLKVLEIPYVGDYSMIVLLPKSIQGEFEDIYLNYTNYQKWTSTMTKKEVILSMPKFKLENTLQLSDALKKNGLSTSFTSQANFKGIIDENIHIDRCYQYAFIAVNEEKTEAAAVGVSFIEAMAGINEDQPVVFNMNHPFVFLILSNKNKTVLFFGKVNVITNYD